MGIDSRSTDSEPAIKAANSSSLHAKGYSRANVFKPLPTDGQSVTGSGVMGDKFIPNGDYPFSTMAGNFARVVARDPERFGLTVNDAEALVAAVGQFQAAFQQTKMSARSSVITRAKDDAREEAERLIKRALKFIR